jgi:hypothetical protein
VHLIHKCCADSRLLKEHLPVVVGTEDLRIRQVVTERSQEPPGCNNGLVGILSFTLLMEGITVRAEIQE